MSRIPQYTEGHEKIARLSLSDTPLAAHWSCGQASARGLDLTFVKSLIVRGT
jgi:hypothetical protein